MRWGRTRLSSSARTALAQLMAFTPLVAFTPMKRAFMCQRPTQKSILWTPLRINVNRILCYNPKKRKENAHQKR